MFFPDNVLSGFLWGSFFIITFLVWSFWIADDPEISLVFGFFWGAADGIDGIHLLLQINDKFIEEV